MPETIFDRDELDLIVGFAGCSLDESPGKNWVEGVGGLPEYICQVARAVKRSGKSTSQAVAIAVSRVKKWASGGDDVDADTRAKAAKALAQWEAKKARSKAKTVKATHRDDHAVILCLANVDYNVDLVKQAFDQQQREVRKAWRAQHPNGSYEDGPQHLYVKEQWTAYLIVAGGYGETRELFKVPYTVDKNLNVTFGDAQKVKTSYVVVKDADLGDDGTLSDADLKKLMELSGPLSGTDRLLHNRPYQARSGALARIVALANQHRPDHPAGG